ncbi:hypothetical protein [Vibrio fortis]|uniref:hypothetical protein n=1 Tax=Vibrio fortis TaxID=212667 RepID=UPI0038CD3AF6
MEYNLTDTEKKRLEKYGYLLANRKIGKRTWNPLLALKVGQMRRVCRDQHGKFKEGYRYISDKLFGFTVGKYSTGYEQFLEQLKTSKQ